MTNGRTLVLAVVCLLAACGGATNTGGGGSIIPNDDAGRSSGVSCERVCTAQVAAMCSGFTMGTCVSQCNSALARVPAACRSALEATLRCGYTATFTCTSSGGATTTACQSEAMVFTACLATASAVDASVPRDGG